MKRKIKSCILQLLYILTLGFVFNSCGKSIDDNLSEKEEFEIVKKCLDKLGENGSEQQFVVSPRYEPFQFNSFFRKNKVLERYKKDYDYDHKKVEVLSSLGWTNEDFNNVQQRINKEYFGKSNFLLSKLSNSNASRSVFLFSGIHRNLVFAELIDFCDYISVSDLKSTSLNKNQKFMSATSCIFLLKDGEVKNMIIDSDITLEFQCP